MATSLIRVFRFRLDYIDEFLMRMNVKLLINMVYMASHRMAGKHQGSLNIRHIASFCEQFENLLLSARQAVILCQSFDGGSCFFAFRDLAWLVIQRLKYDILRPLDRRITR